MTLTSDFPSSQSYKYCPKDLSSILKTTQLDMQSCQHQEMDGLDLILYLTEESAARYNT